MTARLRSRRSPPLQPDGHCHGCNKALTGRQKLWCEPNGQCAQRYWATHNWGLLRSYVLKRDGHTCRICGRKGGRLEADHILPLAEGGAEFDLDNVRTLCHECHLVVTAQLRRRLAAAQRKPRLLAHQKTKYVQPWPGLEPVGQ